MPLPLAAIGLVSVLVILAIIVCAIFIVGGARRW
jgi:hypothetical protein